LLERVDAGDRALAGVEQAVTSVLVAEGEHGSFRFVHALVREVLVDELSTVRRDRLHAAVGRELASSSGASAADVAHHLRAGASAANIDDVAFWSFAAIEEAFDHLAWEDAEAHAAALVRVLKEAGLSLSVHHAKALLELALARNLLTHDPRGRKFALQAADIAKAVGSTDVLIEAALHYGDYGNLGRPNPVSRQLLEDALAVAGPDRPADRARLLSCYASYLAINEGGGLAVAEPHLTEAERLARLSNEDEALGWVLVNSCALWAGSTDVHRQLRLAEELASIAGRATGHRRHPRRDAVLRRDLALRFRAPPALQGGNRLTFDQDHNELRSLAQDSRDLWLHAIVATFDFLVALMEGRTADAQRLIDQAQTSRRGDPLVYAAQLYHLRRDQGRLDEILQPTEAFGSAPDALPIGKALLSLAYLDLGRDRDARDIFDSLATGDLAELPQDPTTATVLAILAELCGTVGNAHQAATIGDLCAHYVGQLVVLGTGTCCVGAMDRYRAIAASSVGDYAAADRLFTAAVDIETSARAWGCLARTRLTWARSLAHRDQPRAARLLSQVRSDVINLGMSGLRVGVDDVERVLA
jgi:hypothetical protein